MSRPRRSEHNRQALLDEGIRQLSEQGYHGTGIKQILDAVNVPKGSFYNYFESKEAFVAAIVDEYTARHTELFDRFVREQARPAREVIEQVQDILLGKYAADQCQRGCLVGSLAAEIGASSELCQQALSTAREHWQARFTRLFRDAQAQAHARQDLSAEALADLYWAAWEGALIRMKLEGSVEGARRVMSSALTLIFTP